MPSYLPLVTCCARRNGYYAGAVRVRELTNDDSPVAHKDYGDKQAIPRCGVPLYQSRSGAWRHASRHLLPARARGQR
jgi:hypothetical protein